MTSKSDDSGVWQRLRRFFAGPTEEDSQGKHAEDSTDVAVTDSVTKSNFRSSPSDSSSTKWFLLPKGGHKRGPFGLEDLKVEVETLTSLSGLRLKKDNGPWKSWANARQLFPELVVANSGGPNVLMLNKIRVD